MPIINGIYVAPPADPQPGGRTTKTNELLVSYVVDGFLWSWYARIFGQHCANCHRCDGPDERHHPQNCVLRQSWYSPDLNHILCNKCFKAYASMAKEQGYAKIEPFEGD